MNQNDVYLARLKMVFELSQFCIEMKIKYYQTLFPDKTKEEVTGIVYQELVDSKNKELENASRQYTKSKNKRRNSF